MARTNGMKEGIGRAHQRETAEIFRLIGVLQRRNRTVRGVPGTSVTLSEIHSLLELEIDSNRTMAELGCVLALDPSSVSRAIGRLSRKGLVRSRVSGEDGRAREISLTEKGRRFIAAADIPAEESLLRLSKHLAQGEIAALRELFSLLSEALHVPAAHARPHEHPLRAPQRRMTRALGLLRDTLPGSSTSISEWQALSILAHARHPLSTGEVASEIGLSPLALAQILPRLEQRGLMQRTARAGRGVKLVATDKANQSLDEIEAPLIQKLNAALSNLPVTKLIEYRSIFERFLGRIGDGQYRLPSGLLARLLFDEESLSRMRASVIRSIVESGAEMKAPAEIVHPAAFNIVLQNGTVSAFGEVQHTLLSLLCVWRGEARQLEQEMRQAARHLCSVEIQSTGLIVQAPSRCLL